ncbi:BamA/TamA family outer membrane protein [Formosa haliotis]|uniref:BamA/TamA family outer membrane protein n=1 Tax=Formosa haliotis TaxID=1555194 RepID=UPI00082481EB|nr:BamA/TamA family outer membrane protein [Formosa haliotis]
MKHISFFIFFLCLFLVLPVQGQKERKYVFKDSLDHKLDFSDFLLNPKGFIPFAQPVTEPALGNIGIMGGPVFIHPNKHPVKEYTPPNITTILGGYSANKSWAVGVYHLGYNTKHKFKYSFATGYGSVNMDYYREVLNQGEKDFEFNFKSIPVDLTFMKQIGDSKLYLGVEYDYMHSEITPNFDFEHLPDFVNEKDISSTLSSPGLIVEYDSRDSMFTPDKGTFFNATYHINEQWTGSDYNFQDLRIEALQFLQFTHNWVSGFRLQLEFQSDNAPFYLEPAVELRGVPKSRYQGKSTYLVETEQRYDITMRWSAVAFAGMAKAVREKENFDAARLVYNYGSGFRYLIARKFKLRVGLDFAWSNNDFGYYIVFGSSWNQRN